MKYSEYMDKKPKELTTEQLLELTNQIAMIEYSRRNDIQYLQDSEDTAQSVLTYLYDKSSRGKIGIKEIQDRCENNMKHFINTLHMETRNSINYIIRKPRTQNSLYKTDSLNELVHLEGDVLRERHELIPDKESMVKVEQDIELNHILSHIDKSESNRIIIKYGSGTEETSFKFSYRNLTKLYFDISSNKKLIAKDFKGLFYNSKTGQELEDNQVKEILKNYKNYMKRNHILGGAY